MKAKVCNIAYLGVGVAKEDGISVFLCESDFFNCEFKTFRFIYKKKKRQTNKSVFRDFLGLAHNHLKNETARPVKLSRDPWLMKP